MSATLGNGTVGVMGSGSDEHEPWAKQVGEALAALGVNLLTGGGGGVMTSVSRAFVRAPRTQGICIGVAPCASVADRAAAKPGYPNEFVELAIRTHLPASGAQGESDLSRNHINVLSSDAIVALPGGSGTASEVALALRYGKPVIVFSPDPAAARALPAAARRAVTIGEVVAFLRPILGAPRV